MLVADFLAQRALDHGAGDWRALPTSALDRISPSSSVQRGCHVHLCDHDCLDDNLRNRHFRGFVHLSIEERVRGAQATILAISLGALVLAALFSERRLHESAMLEREARLQEALRA